MRATGREEQVAQVAALGRRVGVEQPLGARGASTRRTKPAGDDMYVAVHFSPRVVEWK